MLFIIIVVHHHRCHCHRCASLLLFFISVVHHYNCSSSLLLLFIIIVVIIVIIIAVHHQRCHYCCSSSSLLLSLSSSLNSLMGHFKDFNSSSFNVDISGSSPITCFSRSSSLPLSPSSPSSSGLQRSFQGIVIHPIESVKVFLLCVHNLFHMAGLQACDSPNLKC